MRFSPFLVSPQPIKIVRIGDSASGEIGFITRGFVSVREQQALDELFLKESQLQLKAIELVKLISENEGISREEVAKLLQSPEIKTEITEKYEAQISSFFVLNSELSLSQKQLKAQVFLKYRIILPEEFQIIQGFIDGNNLEELRTYCNNRAICEQIPSDFVGNLSNHLIDEIITILEDEQVKKSKSIENTPSTKE